MSTLLFNSSPVKAQTEAFVKGKKYTLDSISVKGLKNFNDRTVISYSGLRKGQTISLPGEEISAVIKKLWDLDLFSNINVYVTQLVDDKASIEIELSELPALSEIKIRGLKKEK